MKMSISVPDTLWTRARAAGGDANPSHLVQDALRRYVKDGGAKSAYSLTAPEDVAEALGAVREQFTGQARALFEEGYRAAVAAFHKLSWHDIEFLADSFRFDVKRWAESYQRLDAIAARRDSMTAHEKSLYPEAAEVEVTLQALVTALGDWANPHGSSELEPGPTYVRGFTQAARDLWREISEGDSAAARTGLEGGGEA